MKNVILVYSGGLDTSVCIPMMKEDYGYDHVVTVTVDVGQPQADIDQAESKARVMGTEHYTVDAKEEFASEFCFASVKANGDYEGYPISTSIARPLIAKKAVEVGQKLGCSDFAHGSTGKGNDQFRIEFAIRAHMPEATIVAPMRERSLTRSWEIEYAIQRGIPITVSADKIYSIDENLWGRSIEGGRLEEPNFHTPEDVYIWTTNPIEAPNTPREVTIGFENGIPVSIDGQKMAPVALIAAMNKIAGENGVGRVDIMEDRMLGLKARENYECPAAVVLLNAHKALEALVLTREELKFKTMVDAQWGEMAYAGLWFDPLKEDLEAFINKSQERVNGEVTLRLYKGGMRVAGRKSDWALYSEDLISFDTDTFDQSEMTGMVKNFGMQARMLEAIRQKRR